MTANELMGFLVTHAQKVFKEYGWHGPIAFVVGKDNDMTIVGMAGLMDRDKRPDARAFFAKAVGDATLVAFVSEAWRSQGPAVAQRLQGVPPEEIITGRGEILSLEVAAPEGVTRRAIEIETVAGTRRMGQVLPMGPPAGGLVDDLPWPGWTVVHGPCASCKKPQSVSVPVEGYARWQRGELIQRAMPTVPLAAREFLISETCPSCFAEFFPPGRCGHDHGDDAEAE
jgi:hypothetical protein